MCLQLRWKWSISRDDAIIAISRSLGGIISARFDVDDTRSPCTRALAMYLQLHIRVKGAKIKGVAGVMYQGISPTSSLLNFNEIRAELKTQGF